MTPIKLDLNQQTLFEFFEKISKTFDKKTNIKNIVSKFLPKNKKHGVYLYGPVGGGKTMLMEMFYKMISCKKEIIHFQNFMQEVHKKLHKFQLNKNPDKLIKTLAEDIKTRTKVLCIDEFEVKDIADAMIIMRLFVLLSKLGVFVFLTTNTPPENLYKDGLQRESFLPFIDSINTNFFVLNLDNHKDYRFSNAFFIKNKILFPFNKQTRSSIEEIKNNLCPAYDLYPGTFELFGRIVVFPKTHHNILFTNFNELFLQNFSYADYVNLCTRFKIIVLENVRKITENETDIITRFINFIDNAYFYKIILFSSLETEPSLLYNKGKRLNEFQRTISRLNEMDSFNDQTSVH